jgi:hypothetical protein
MMFAKDKADAINIYFELSSDSLIGSQGVIFRRYEKLETFEIGINGLPFANEWRFFFYKGEMISYGYYWGIAENIPDKIDPEGIEFAQKVANICKDYANFYVLDVAKKENGEWVLVEVNDGSMSGLSCNDDDVFYISLSNVLKRVDSREKGYNMWNSPRESWEDLSHLGKLTNEDIK